MRASDKHYGTRFEYVILVILFIAAVVLGALLFRVLTSQPRQIPVYLPDGTVFIVDVALNQSEKVLGLSSRDSIRSKEGMLINYGRPDLHTVWLEDMFFSVDVVWLLDNQIVGITKDVPPERERVQTERYIYRAPTKANQVLQLPTGTVDWYDLEVGQVIEW